MKQLTSYFGKIWQAKGNKTECEAAKGELELITEVSIEQFVPTGAVAVRAFAWLWLGKRCTINNPLHPWHP